MYVLMVVATLLVLPSASIAVETFLLRRPFRIRTVRRWFVFWAVGVRLLVAGLRQILQPEFTAEEILGLHSHEALFLVRELGFANTAIGLAGVTCGLTTGWDFPLTLIGAVFYGLAGVNHALQDVRTGLQEVAMISDLGIAVLLLSLCVSAVVERRSASRP